MTKSQKHQYNRKTIELVDLNYHHTSINPEILLDAAKQAKWKLVSPLINVLKILEGKNSTEDSALNLSTSFIHLTLKENIKADEFYMLFMNLLNVIVKGRWAPSTIRKFKTIIMKRFDLFPLEDRIKILDLIGIWEMVYYKI
jgi:hypothetical protein